MHYDIIIVGAGLTGLTTGYYLNKAGKKILIIDKRNRVGGVIETVHEEDFTYELGPNTGVIADIIMQNFFEEIVDEQCELEVANPKNVGKRYIAFKGKWHKIPTTPIGGLITPLFSWRDKFSLPFEPLRKRGTNVDETLAEMVVRRMGKSFLDHVIDPFILGVYAGDPHQLVPSYGLRKLYNLEQDFGSFIGGTIKKLIYNKKHGIKNPSRKIFSFKNGLDQLPKGIARKIGQEKFLLGVDSTVVNVKNNGEFTVQTVKNGENLTFSATRVITTCGSHALANILPFIPTDAMQHINNCLYAKVIEVHLGFKNWQGMKLDGFGGLCPFNQHHDILGILFMSATQTSRAPENGALLTIFLGGVRRQDIIEKNDEEIIEILKREVTNLMRLPAFNPDLIKIIRHQYAIPQYGKESKARFETVEKMQAQFPNLTLGGNFVAGIGMSKRIVHGYEMAQKIINS